MESDSGLASIFYNPKDPGSFSSAEALFNRAKEEGIKTNRAQVEEFLADQDAYTLHRKLRKKFQRNPIVVGAIDKQWQADLADMSSIAKDNDGYKFLLTVIDCFSKYAWAIPIKTKSASSLLQAFKNLFEKSHPRKPNRLQTDKGTEFLNKSVQALFKENAIHHFTSESDQKAAMVERFNRTLKSRMWKYFTAKNTYRYLDVLDDLLYAYNHAKHRTIGMAPADVKVEHEESLWNRMYGNRHLLPAKPIKVGEPVRISKTKRTFEKGYVPNWTEEIFKVKGMSQGKSRKVFKLHDWLDEPIGGVFYPEEVQKVVRRPDKIFVIEKILKKKKAGKILSYLVKWRGLPKKFNSWIDAKDVQQK